MIAMNNLGFLPKKKDYENMLKYYLMAIDHGFDDCYVNLCFYYEEQEDYDNMIKYIYGNRKKKYLIMKFLAPGIN